MIFSRCVPFMLTECRVFSYRLFVVVGAGRASRHAEDVGLARSRYGGYINENRFLVYRPCACWRAAGVHVWWDVLFGSLPLVYSDPTFSPSEQQYVCRSKACLIASALFQALGAMAGLKVDTRAVLFLLLLHVLQLWVAV